MHSTSRTADGAPQDLRRRAEVALTLLRVGAEALALEGGGVLVVGVDLVNNWHDLVYSGLRRDGVKK